MKYHTGVGQDGMVYVTINDKRGEHTVSISGIKNQYDRASIRAELISLSVRGSEASEIFGYLMRMASLNECSASYYFCRSPGGAK